MTGLFRKFYSPLPWGRGVQFLRKKNLKKFENQPPVPPNIKEILS